LRTCNNVSVVAEATGGGHNRYVATLFAGCFLRGIGGTTRRTAREKKEAAEKYKPMVPNAEIIAKRMVYAWSCVTIGAMCLPISEDHAGMKSRFGTKKEWPPGNG